MVTGPPPSDSTDVSVIGTGLMGAAIARALLQAGRSVTVWNRSEPSARQLEPDGAVVAATATAAFQASPVTVVVVKGYDTVRDLAETASADGPVGDVINLVTGTPQEADDLASWAATAGLSYLDGAIFGFPPDIGSEHLPIMCSGDQDVFDRHQSLISAIGGASAHLGVDVRLANAWDAAVLTLVNGTAVAVMEGLALGMAHDLDPDLLLAIYQGALSMQAAELPGLTTRLGAADQDADDSSIATWKGGTEMIVRAAADAGVRNRTADAALATYADVEAAGLGRAPMTAIVEERLRSRQGVGA